MEMIMKSVLRVFLIAVALLSQYSAATMAWAQDDEVPNSKAAKKLPDPLTEYKGRVIAQTMHYTGAPWLTRDNREQEERCTLMLANLGVKRGMTICDMGCGNGFYTLQLAKMVGETGKVNGVD